MWSVEYGHQDRVVQPSAHPEKERERERGEDRRFKQNAVRLPVVRNTETPHTTTAPQKKEIFTDEDFKQSVYISALDSC